MSEFDPSTDQTRPLARVLFGWAFMFKRGGIILVTLALLGTALIVAEIALGRAPLDLMFEDLPGFYAAAGFGVVALVLGAVFVLNATVGRLPPPEDEA